MPSPADRIWTRVSRPNGEAVGLVAGPPLPFLRRSHRLRDARGETVGTVFRQSGKEVCSHNGVTVARTWMLRGRETRRPGTRDFYNRYGQSYKLELTDKARGPLQELLIILPVVIDLSHDEFSSKSIAG